VCWSGQLNHTGPPDLTITMCFPSSDSGALPPRGRDLLDPARCGGSFPARPSVTGSLPDPERTTSGRLGLRYRELYVTFLSDARCAPAVRASPRPIPTTRCPLVREHRRGSSSPEPSCTRLAALLGWMAGPGASRALSTADCLKDTWKDRCRGRTSRPLVSRAMTRPAPPPPTGSDTRIPAPVERAVWGVLTPCRRGACSAAHLASTTLRKASKLGFLNIRAPLVEGSG